MRSATLSPTNGNAALEQEMHLMLIIATCCLLNSGGILVFFSYFVQFLGKHSEASSILNSTWLTNLLC